MKGALQFLSFLLMVLFSLPFALLPYGLSMKLGEVMGVLLYYLWKSRRNIAIENLQAALLRGAINIDSTPEAAIKRNFKNMGKSFAELVKIYYGFGRRIFERVEVKGAENYRKALEKGAGILVITGHCGNWELNALYSSMKLTKMNVVARPLNNPYLNWFIEKARKRYGNNIIYKKGALKKILQALKRNEAVGILMDQSVLKDEGVLAEFLGKKDYTMKTPATLARRTGAAVLPVFGRRVGRGGYLIEIGSEIELDNSENYKQAVYNDTVRFSGYIENYIKNNPYEWLWIHRRWKRIKA